MNDDGTILVVVHLPDEDLEIRLPKGAIPCEGEIIYWEGGSGMTQGTTMRVGRRSWTMGKAGLTSVHLALDSI